MSIRKRGKTWQVRLSYLAPDGTRKEKSKGGFTKKKDAMAYETELKYEFNQFSSIEKRDMLFTTYYDSWLENHLKLGLSERTITNHRITQKAVHERLGNLTMKEITRPIFQKFINDLAETRKASTVRQYFNRVSMPLKEAFHEGIITSDPTYKIVIPNIKREVHKIKYLEADEMSILKTEIENTALTPPNFAIYISLLSGLRLGEVLALTYKDIDLANKTLSVSKNRSLTRPYTVGKTKTKSSNRTIKMPDAFFEQLERYKINYPKADERFLGNNLPAETCNYQLKRLLKKNNLTPISFHGLRHTHASYLINSGIDIAYVSERLGHANISMTQQTYFHLLKNKRESEQDRAMALFRE